MMLTVSVLYTSFQLFFFLINWEELQTVYEKGIKHQAVMHTAEYERNKKPKLSLNFQPALKNEHVNGPIVALFFHFKQYSRLKFKKFILINKDDDNCVLLRNKTIVKIENII